MNLSIAKDIQPELSTYIVLKFLYKIGKIVYTGLRSDDFIDMHDIEVDLNSGFYNLEREFSFIGKKQGSRKAHYYASIKVQKI